MRNSLLWKIILAFLMVALTTAVIVAFFVRQTSEDRLMSLILEQQETSLQEILATYYTTNGSWEGMTHQEWNQLRYRSMPTPIAPQPINNNPPPENPPQNQNDHQPSPIDRRRLFGLASETGKVLIPVNPNQNEGTVLSAEELKEASPILVNGKTVGYILIMQSTPSLNPEEIRYLDRTNQALTLGVGGALLVTLVLGIFLARTLIRPLRELTRAAQNIAEGQLEQQVKVTSKDEVGQLALAFNRMSQEVARSNQLRRQMTADIAHDLRTPLTVIAGYVESMRDEVLKPTPERLAVIYTEIERLQHLVGDLRMLSQADAGELPLTPQILNPRMLLEHAVAPFQHRASQDQIELTVDADKDLPKIQVDEARMMQVFGNLISNSLRYTPIDGKITLSAAQADDHMVLEVNDTGTGIKPEDLPNIFNRFHRSDKSRYSDEGESGLGLAIVKALVEAQGGTVHAKSNLGSGTSIYMEFPLVHA